MPSVLRVPPASRNQEIDTLRAIACIALVSFHVVGNSSASGLELPEAHWMSRVNEALVDLRMPLFSVLSGLVFPDLAGAGAPWRRMGGKMRRLLVPMGVVGAAFWAARAVAGHQQIPLPGILVMPFAHFWFLQATFLIMAACLLGTWLAGGRDRLAVAVVGLGGAALYLSPLRPEVNLFSVIQAWMLAPFFAGGYMIARMPRIEASPAVRRAAVVGLVAALGAGATLSWGLLTPEPMMRRAVGFGLGALFCGLLLVVLRPRHAGLALLGRHSYAIYLFHVFFTAGVIEVMSRLDPAAAPVTVWALALAAGLGGPVLLEALLMRHPGTALLCLGIRLTGGRWVPGIPARRDPAHG